MDSTQANSLTSDQMQQLWGMIMGAWVFIGVFILVIRVLAIWFFWRIFEKAGYNGAIALINILSIGTLISILILAFGTWPIEQRLAGEQRPSQPRFPSA